MYKFNIFFRGNVNFGREYITKNTSINFIIALQERFETTNRDQLLLQVLAECDQ